MVRIGWHNMEYGLIGEKLGHSFSRVVHNKLFDYEYTLKEIPKTELSEFLTKKDFKAINVTIPYKQKVIPFLDEVDGVALKIGAVNTVVNKNGRLFGYNTDFSGLKAMILHNEIEIAGKKVLILGNGGTSKTAKAVLEDLNAKEILILSRKSGDGVITYDEATEKHTDADVIINTTPCGMYPDLEGEPISIDAFKKLSAVVDVVYNPLSTRLVINARKKGIKAVNGLYMLIAQAVFAAERFIDTKVPKDEILKIYNELLAEKRNLVLIGMPSSGKTTIGKAISRELNKEFFDSDEEIVKQIGISIPEFFKAEGEKAFRTLESRVIAELSLKQGAVIATGGGAILNEKNTELLRANGKLIFIDRPLENLLVTDDRPLSATRELLEKRYNERYNLYLKAADNRVDAKHSIEKNQALVKEAFLDENFGA